MTHELLAAAANAARTVGQAAEGKADGEVIATDARSLRQLSKMLHALYERLRQLAAEPAAVESGESGTARQELLDRAHADADAARQEAAEVRRRLLHIAELSAPIEGDMAMFHDAAAVLRDVNRVARG
ncbi:hypothetical protein [Sphingomonas sp. IW22]|uniref:hypothetical protein n=1 Tax=Sphingomonas sp. IW22 TaxID=3242489 RepID=UPI0035213320